MSLLTELGFVWVGNYKDVTPTALESLPTPSAGPRFFQLPPRRDGNMVEDMNLDGPSQTPPITPTPQPEAERLAQRSFELGILSIFCGLTALPAIIQSIRALIRIRKDGASKAARRKAIFSLIFSSCTFAFLVFMIISPIRAAQAMADEINCVNNMKQLVLAIKIYEGDYGMFPSNRWCDTLLANKEVMTESSIKIFHCPAANKKQRSSYAMNRNLVGINDNDKISPDTVLLFESDAGWNAIGGHEIAAARHYGPSLSVGFIDGSVERIELKDIGNLRWNPYTNAPATAGK